MRVGVDEARRNNLPADVQITVGGRARQVADGADAALQDTNVRFETGAPGAVDHRAAAQQHIEMGEGHGVHGQE